MSPSQRTVFTALPNGPIADQPGRYRLSVHIAPQLKHNVDTVLSTFPDWATWPAKVNAIGWAVSFGGGEPVAATVASTPARSDLWTGLFGNGAGVLVRSHTPPDVANRKVRSYPARNVMAWLQKSYTDVAVNSPEEFPHIDDLMNIDVFGRLDVDTLKLFTSIPPQGLLDVEAVLATDKAYTNGPPLTKLVSDFYQLYRFHRSRYNVKALSDAEAPIPPVVKPKLDFHQVVSSAGQYPPLLRLLGLVVDLVVDVGGTLPPSPTDVRVVPTWTPSPPDGGGPSDSATPRTRCLIDGGQFRARPRPIDPELVDGRLPFNDTDRFTLLQVDQDGGALKAIDFAGNLRRFLFTRSIATPDRYALPSLRSGGLAVARINRAVGFVERVGRSAAAAGQLGQDAPGEVMLDAEDVTRGHRVDVWDTREREWFSLAARTGNYRFPGGVNVAFTDESWTTAAVTEDDTATQDLYLQETLFRWGGWSLAAPRPGGRIATTQEQDPPVTTDPVAIDPDFPVSVDAKALPSSLPRLRFGRTYEVRARAVDLAGNSDPLDPTGEDRRRTPPVDYLRFEPVQSPPVLNVAPRTEGESLEQVVLRSNYNVPPRGDAPARHIVPPKADQLLAEQHGLFDTPFNPESKVDPAKYTTITKYVKPAPDDANAPVVQSEQGSFAISSERVRDPNDHTKSFYYPVELVTLPYLPDPMAEGAALVFLDHPQLDPGGRVPAQFRTDEGWPIHRPIRLVLEEGSGAPAYNESTRQLVVPLEKADVVHVRLSAYPPREHIEKMGIWQWIKGRPNGPQMIPRVLDGRHWMITPFRLLTLVHAVRQPLLVPRFPDFGGGPTLVPIKVAGQTFATFDGGVAFSRKSTSRIDVVSSWGEYIDRGPGTSHPTAPNNDPPAPPSPRQALAFTIPGDRAGAPNIAVLSPETERQEFGDTRHRQVRYTPIATTKFGEYFVESRDVVVNFPGAENNINQIILLPTDSKGFVPGSVKVKKKVESNLSDGTVKGAASYVEGTHYTASIPAGAVILKPGLSTDGYAQEGDTLTISYLVPPIVRPGPGEPDHPVVLSIKNSGLPAAPKVLYVVPTFGWEFEADPIFGTRHSTRRGRGLRVYLERPWWSSGEGELLGVVLPNPNAAPSEALGKMVTRLGVDPVFKSTSSPSSLNVFSFEGGKEVGLGPGNEGLPIPGFEGHGKVFAVGYEVAFDDDRDLWFCDIQLHAKSYFPFIKLGLVRFQPESVNGMHLSPVVVTDFCQLTPDRFATVSQFGLPPGKRSVTVTGPGYSRVGDEVLDPLVKVTVERLDPALGTDLGWSVIGDVVTLDRKADQGENSVWSGQVTVPGAPAGTKQRLVIEEFERHRTGVANNIGERLVYSDIVDL